MGADLGMGYENLIKKSGCGDLGDISCYSIRDSLPLNIIDRLA
ncbi:conserved protein of unknown function [Limnospira indica PCC 8005]|uniref:Uncharacterized protein n=1 Tax=Limnospira indica PCC 8005 TaxID=376219 RepID=A0A9P1KLM6_9CYAN|nr:conserved protein of unknown function [Limnospira indica PCC 8005]